MPRRRRGASRPLTAAEKATCFAEGTDRDWTQTARFLHLDMVRPPRCNRTTGHRGSHRQYDGNARVLAEWENTPFG